MDTEAPGASQGSTTNVEPPNSEKPLTDDPFFCVHHCDGHCCRDYTVLVTAQDARRIIDRVPGLDVLDFICFYHGEVETQNYYPKINIQGEEYVLGILTHDKTESCVFQTGLGLCGIHDFSPMVCQTYPFTLTADDEVTYIEGVYCKELFPPVDPDRVVRVVHQSWREIKVYRELVAEWNGRLSHRGTRKFLKFAGLVDYEEPPGPERDLKFDWEAHESDEEYEEYEDY
ncbi:MAG: hypothetical protein Kow0069_00620 [Promethearchaeota archaeon]